AQFELHFGIGLCAKLGLSHRAENVELGERLLKLMHEARVDFTLAFRRLTDLAADADATFTELFGTLPVTSWLLEWRHRVELDGGFTLQRCEAMRRANPAFIPRNHLVEAAIEAATAGNLQPFERLRTALSHPYDDQPTLSDLTAPPGD